MGPALSMFVSVMAPTVFTKVRILVPCEFANPPKVTTLVLAALLVMVTCALYSVNVLVLPGAVSCESMIWIPCAL